MDIHFDPKVKDALDRAKDQAITSGLEPTDPIVNWARENQIDLIESDDHEHAWYRVGSSYYLAPRGCVIETITGNWSTLVFPNGTPEHEAYPNGIEIHRRAFLKETMTVNGKTLS